MLGTSIFLAGAEVETLTRALLANGTRNILYSYFYIMQMRREAFIDRMMNEHPDVNWFLDSGAFTYSAKFKSEPDKLPPLKQYLKRYWAYIDAVGERYCRITEPDMDIAGQSVEWVDEQREFMLDRWPHLNVTPVWHAGRTVDDWFGYCIDKRIKSIAIGSGDAKDIGRTRNLVMMAQQHGKPVHGFGLTRINTTLKHIPFDSVDSSVGGESLVWLRNADTGAVEVLTIKRLYNRYPAGITDNLQTQTVRLMCGEYVTAWAPLDSVVRHVVTKPFVRITLEGGSSLRVTGDHSLFTMGVGGRLSEIKPSELTEGDWLATSRAPTWGGVGVREHVVLTTKYHGPSKLWLAEETRVEFDDTWLRFVGLWLADGSYCNGSVQLSVANSPECLRVVQEMADRYGRRLSISDNGTDCRFSCARLVRAMKQLGLHGESHTKKLPKWFWTLSREQAGQLLKGYFSGDGSSGVSPYVTTTSRKLWRQLSQAVPAVLGEFVQVSWSRSRRSSFGGMARPSGRITLSSNRVKKAFIQHIGFLQQYKIDGVVFKDDDRGGYHDMLPVELARRRLIRGKQTNGGNDYVRGSFVGRNVDKDGFSMGVLSESLVYLKVKRIDVLELKEREVFDLSVPGPERFLANGILAHNTTWVMGQKLGTTYIFRNNRFQLIPMEQKYKRKLYVQYFRDIGCDPKLVLADDTAEVRNANIKAWVALAARFEYMKQAGRQSHGVNNVVMPVFDARDHTPGKRPEKVPSGLARDTDEVAMPKQRDPAELKQALPRPGVLTELLNSRQPKPAKFDKAGRQMVELPKVELIDDEDEE